MMVHPLGGLVKALTSFNLTLLIRLVGVARVVDFLKLDTHVPDP